MCLECSYVRSIEKAQVPKEIMKLTREGPASEVEEAWRYLIAFSYQSGHLISQIPDKNKAKTSLKDYLDFNVDIGS